MFLRSQKINPFIVLFSIAVFLIPTVPVGLSKERERDFGELNIEGEKIESLVLRHLGDWHTESFEPPFESKKIPIETVI